MPDGCWQTLKSMMDDKGIEIIVSAQAPLMAGPYTTDPFTCPHGISYWIEPTSEQIAQWVRDGVR